MLFSTPFFLFVFLPILFGLYWLIPARRPVLLLGSLVFYGWSEPIFLCVVVVSSAFDWFLGRFLAAEGSVRRRKLLTGAGVINNIGLLVYAKYTVFGFANLNYLLERMGQPALVIPTIVLPLGVSFIVFEKITYVVDLYRRVAPPAPSFLDYLNYVFLFPKLLAGPIVKYHDIADQLRRPAHRYEDVRDGLTRFIVGLSKKVLIADSLAPSVDWIFRLPHAELDAATAWIGITFFAVQLYFDFSGYSDMAIGLGRMLGFRLRENFNHPYLATSFTDFWRRWHISLSTWIRDYLYFPLGGSRGSTFRTYFNLWVCFVLCGLWHGAAWNFVLFGCLHGLVLVADRAFWLRWQRRLPFFANVILTDFLFVLTLVLFRNETIPGALGYYAILFAGGETAVRHFVLEPDVLFFFLVGLAIIVTPLLRVPDRARGFPVGPALRLGGALALLCLCFGRLAVSSFQPFVYFRF